MKNPAGEKEVGCVTKNKTTDPDASFSLSMTSFEFWYTFITKEKLHFFDQAAFDIKGGIKPHKNRL